MRLIDVQIKDRIRGPNLRDQLYCEFEKFMRDRDAGADLKSEGGLVHIHNSVN